LSLESYYDYIGSDPVVPIKIITHTISDKYLAFLDVQESITVLQVNPTEGRIFLIQAQMV